MKIMLMAKSEPSFYPLESRFTPGSTPQMAIFEGKEGLLVESTCSSVHN